MGPCKGVSWGDYHPSPISPWPCAMEASLDTQSVTSLDTQSAQNHPVCKCHSGLQKGDRFRAQLPPPEQRLQGRGLKSTTNLSEM